MFTGQSVLEHSRKLVSEARSIALLMSRPSGVSSTGDCSLVHWKLPCPEWHSLNIDGVVSLSSGGLLRDDGGNGLLVSPSR
ncbi:hypothetical protein V6N11_019209 [Hibiscus sabdariffa]|uniref:Uncharacterized protein n=2 Tax=Hibiscus sabdariffa TaxID=183260 RepID=A0ABR2BDU3_9ROSI